MRLFVVLVMLMLTTAVFVILAIFLLRRSYLLLLAMLPARRTETQYSGRGVFQIILNLTGLGLWFLAGVLALTSGITGVVNKTILALQ